jgi:hypothetical protein
MRAATMFGYKTKVTITVGGEEVDVTHLLSQDPTGFHLDSKAVLHAINFVETCPHCGHER